jgi:hypothetical protein
VSPEVLDLKGYPVDLEVGDVQQHIWLLIIGLLAVGFLAKSGCLIGGVVGVLLWALFRHGLPPSPTAPSGGSSFPLM